MKIMTIGNGAGRKKCWVTEVRLSQIEDFPEDREAFRLINGSKTSLSKNEKVLGLFGLQIF